MPALAYSWGTACKTFTLEQLREAMVGNKYRNTEAFLDEISVAHKPIDQVMAEAAGLVTNVRTLHQMVIEKATSTADVALRRRLQGATSVRKPDPVPGTSSYPGRSGTRKPVSGTR